MGTQSRRRLLGAAGAAALVAVAAPARGAIAQDPSPAASPAASPVAVAAREVPSDEATADQLAIAQAEGAAYGRALAAMAQQAEVRTQTAGQYEVSLVAEPAEGLYQVTGGKPAWTEPGDANAHLEVAVRDAGDGRFVPGLTISLALQAPDGSPVATQTMPFVWHPWLYHYGLNWTVPGAGDYTATVRIEPPDFARHDQQNGDRYADPVELTFSIPITPGQK